MGLLSLARVHVADLDIPAMDADHPKDRAFIFILRVLFDRRVRSSIVWRRRRFGSDIAGYLIRDLLFGVVI